MAAAVVGARHRKSGRNGQDAAAAWAGRGRGAVVVCDGCSAGAGSEVGARLAAAIVVAAAARELERGARAAAIWPRVSERVVAAMDRLVGELPGERAQIVGEQFLFTIVAAAYDGEEVAVWAIGDGAYALGEDVRMLGPFAENRPPYLGYALLGEAPRPHLEVASARCGGVMVATDGAAEVGLAQFAGERWVAHPDALRRRLAVLARDEERIDWERRRVERSAAALQDDGAVAVLRWGGGDACPA